MADEHGTPELALIGRIVAHEENDGSKHLCDSNLRHKEREETEEDSAERL